MIKKLSIIVPVYNEARTIERSIREICRYFQEQPFAFELITVDDGSNDESQKIFVSLKKDFPSLIVLRNEQNAGKGAAVRKGMLEASGDWAIFMDADLSTPLATIEEFLPYVDTHDILIGSRALPGSKVLVRQFFLKELSGKLGNFLIKKLLKLHVKDTQCGFKMFNEKASRIFALQTLNRWGFDFEILTIAQERGLRIKELPVVWYNVPNSKVRFIDYWHTLKDLIKVRKGMQTIRDKSLNPKP